MSNLENFLQPSKKDLSKMEILDDGKYGCQKCDLYTRTAYFDHDSHSIYWYCNEGHESVVKFV